jgi:hypothetical protein
MVIGIRDTESQGLRSACATVRDKLCRDYCPYPQVAPEFVAESYVASQGGYADIGLRIVAAACSGHRRDVLWSQAAYDEAEASRLVDP